MAIITIRAEIVYTIEVPEPESPEEHIALERVETKLLEATLRRAHFLSVSVEDLEAILM